jgi:exonuclease III
MRLVTWNCCKGPYARKIAHLETLQADIAVVQECPRPPAESAQCLWFGDNPKQGITVLAREPYQLHRMTVLDDVPKFVIPVAVTGPYTFTLFAVWTKSNKDHRYIRAVVRAVEMYKEIISGGECVVLGDFNSNTVWDHLHPESANHSFMVAQGKALGLVSAYHQFFDEAQGKESRPTYYHHRKGHFTYLIDYCFMPQNWIEKLPLVEIGESAEWLVDSDHCPLIINVDVESVQELPGWAPAA